MTEPLVSETNEETFWEWVNGGEPVEHIVLSSEIDFTCGLCENEYTIVRDGEAHLPTCPKCRSEFAQMVR